MEWVTGVPEEFKTRIRFPMSDREMKRRWSTVQTVMQEQGIDVLIAQNADQYLGGYFRYFTDLPTGCFVFVLKIKFQPTTRQTRI